MRPTLWPFTTRIDIARGKQPSESRSKLAQIDKKPLYRDVMRVPRIGASVSKPFPTGVDRLTFKR